MSDYPQTKDEWWEMLLGSWDKIERFVMSYYPAQERFPKDGYPVDKETTAAQIACNVIIKQIQREKPIWPEDILKIYINRLKDERDPELATILDTTWFGLPETPSIRENPGFFLFCDLCSESYVLSDPQPAINNQQPAAVEDNQ